MNDEIDQQHREMIELTDLATEIKLRKYPFKKGLKPQVGVEYR